MIWTAIILGLVSSLHCVGMCGPIALAVASGGPVSGKVYWSALSYNTGRVVTYGFLGLLFGVVGQGLLVAGVQQKISIISGVLILLLVLLPKKWKHRLGLNFSLYEIPLLRKLFSKNVQNNSYGSRFVIGLMNGLLPCGMVYIAVAAALAQNTIMHAVLYMVLFGLGTFPSMLLVFISGRLLKERFKNALLKRAPLIISLVAVLFIFRGLALGIPYISPKVAATSTHVKAACCEEVGSK